jgi:hypothetical protein
VLSIAAYGFLVSERLAHGATDSAKKKGIRNSVLDRLSSRGLLSFP